MKIDSEKLLNFPLNALWAGKQARFLLLPLLMGLSHPLLSQSADSARVPINLRGAVTVTTKGISTFPNLTLGKPAAIFDLSIGRKLTFDPLLRFSLQGKPWSFLFWFRYKLLTGQKFQMNIGAHPAYSFKTRTFLVDGISKEVLVADRFLAGELTPNISLSKNIGIGIHYLYSYGVGKEITKNSNFISLRSSFSNLRISDNYSLRVNPQLYYLKMDKNDGIFANAAVTLSRRNCPLSLSSMVNKMIRSNIPASKDFLWNLSLIYTVNQQLIKR